MGALEDFMPTTHDAAFPGGTFVLGGVSPVKDFERSTAGQDQQEVVRDGDGNPVLVDGEPIRVWRCEIVAPADEGSTRKSETKFTVTLHAKHQPVLPPGLPMAPSIHPVVLEGLQIRAWAGRNGCKPPREKGRAHFCGAKVTWSLLATGFADPAAAASSAPASAKDSAAAGNGRGS